ncbi:MAG: hypothetical protein ACUVTL_11285 [Thermoproteota archaeon]
MDVDRNHRLIALEQGFLSFKDLRREKARIQAKRLLISRKDYQTRIIHIDGKLIQLSKKYGIDIDLDENEVHDIPLE